MPPRVREYEEQPQAPDLGDAVQLETGVTLVSPPARDPLDAGYIPADWPFVLDEDNTAVHLSEPETLDERLRRERPDVLSLADDPPASVDEEDGVPLAGERRSGRLAPAFVNVDGMYSQSLDGVDCGIDGGAASAEEAAMHDLLDDVVLVDLPMSIDQRVPMILDMPMNVRVPVRCEPPSRPEPMA